MSSAIPILTSPDNQVNLFAEAVKANLDRVTGQQRNAAKLKPLDKGASDEQMRVRLNDLLARLQG